MAGDKQAGIELLNNVDKNSTLTGVEHLYWRKQYGTLDHYTMQPYIQMLYLIITCMYLTLIQTYTTSAACPVGAPLPEREL